MAPPAQPVASPPVVIIVGAGPAGLVAAGTFAQRGYAVQVHDKRPEPPDANTDNAHSFTIVLNQKGIRALSSVGYEAAKQFPLLAVLRHIPGRKHGIPMIEPQPGSVIAVERNELTKQLYDVIKARHPNSVKFVFNSSCQGLDLRKQEVLLGPPAADGQAVGAKPVKYDLLVGADGAHSAVRTSLLGAMPGQFECNVRKAPLVYKRYKRLPCDASLSGKYGSGGAVLHFFGIKLPAGPAAAAPSTSGLSAAIPSTAASSNARHPSATDPATGNASVSATSASAATASSATTVNPADAAEASTIGDSATAATHAGSSTASGAATAASPAASPPSKGTSGASGLSPPGVAGSGGGGTAKQAPPSWGYLTLINNEDGSVSGGLSVATFDQHKLNTPEHYEECLRQTPLPEGTRQVMAQHLAAARWTWAGSWVRCSQLHGPGSVVLIGDAAHAVSPSMGQGCNAALEDVTVLQRLLDERGGAPSLTSLKGLPEEFTRRRLDDVLALVWMDENARAFRGQQGIFNSKFMMYMAHTVLRGRLHTLAPSLVSKPALQVVWETPVPYADILKQMRGDGMTLGLAAAASVTALAAAAVSWARQRR